MLETLVSLSDMLVRVFAVLAALSVLIYLLSSRQLRKANTHEGELRSESESQRARFETEISSAERKLRELQAQNSQLSTQLEQEHQARLNIQRRFGPRAVTAAANSAIVAALQPFAGRKVNIGYFAELETAAFGEQLVETLKTAGWKPQVFKLKTIQLIYGIECGGPDPQDPGLGALTEALKLVDKRLTAEGSGTSIMGQVLQPQLTDQLWVMVGLKRPHLLKRRPSDGASDVSPTDQNEEAVDRD